MAATSFGVARVLQRVLRMLQCIASSGWRLLQLIRIVRIPTISKRLSSLGVMLWTRLLMGAMRYLVFMSWTASLYKFVSTSIALGLADGTGHTEEWAAALGYEIVQGQSVWHAIVMALYWVKITITTVGYTNWLNPRFPHLMLFTAVFSIW